MRTPSLIIGATLVIIGILAIMGDVQTNLGWWLLAALIAAIGAAGLLRASRGTSRESQR